MSTISFDFLFVKSLQFAELSGSRNAVLHMLALLNLHGSILPTHFAQISKLPTDGKSIIITLIWWQTLAPNSILCFWGHLKQSLLDLWFPAGVSRHSRVPWIVARGVTYTYNALICIPIKPARGAARFLQY